MHRVVGDLVHRDVRPRRRRGLVAHPHQALRLPAEGREPGAQCVGDGHDVEVQAPVLQPVQRLVGDGDEGLEAHRRVLLDAHEVEVVVRRMARRPHHGPVGPRRDDVAHRGVRAVAPGACAFLEVAVGPRSAHAGFEFTRYSASGPFRRVHRIPRQARGRPCVPVSRPHPLRSNRMAASPNIVLVHGAWADGSSWSGVIERLQADGYNVTAPQFPQTSLADDVARLRQVLAPPGRPDHRRRALLRRPDHHRARHRRAERRRPGVHRRLRARRGRVDRRAARAGAADAGAGAPRHRRPGLRLAAGGRLREPLRRRRRPGPGQGDVRRAAAAARRPRSAT